MFPAGSGNVFYGFGLCIQHIENSKMRLKQNLKPMLELESGSNDPMAYVMTIVLIQVAKLLYEPASSISGIDYSHLILSSLQTLFLQMTIGSLAGVAIGFAAVWTLKRVKLNSAPLYSICFLRSASSHSR